MLRPLREFDAFFFEPDPINRTAEPNDTIHENDTPVTTCTMHPTAPARLTPIGARPHCYPDLPCYVARLHFLA